MQAVQGYDLAALYLSTLSPSPSFRLVRDTARIFRKHYQKRIKATILYATETGRSRNYANVVNNVFGRVFATKVCCMEDYDRANLEQEQILVIVTSTFGSGDPPANGEVITTTTTTT